MTKDFTSLGLSVPIYDHLLNRLHHSYFNLDEGNRQIAFPIQLHTKKTRTSRAQFSSNTMGKQS